MRTLWGVMGVLAVVGALGAGFFSARVQAASSFIDIEPNDTCATAQELGVLDAPLTILGSLEGSSGPGVVNIDFFRISAIPGSLLRIDMEGAIGNRGTLSDPMLGAFSQGCELLALADDSGGTLNSQIILQAPADGQLVIAATSCCDSSFTTGGSGAGTYTLTVDERGTIGSVGGQVVDAATGEPSSSASVALFQCVWDVLTSCYAVAWPALDDQGRFLITPQDFTSPPIAGSYRLVVSAAGYRDLATPIFGVGAGEDHSLGVLELETREVIGAISGRAVDAETGAPAEGVTVTLERCDIYGSCEWLTNTYSDADGRFSFGATESGEPLYNDIYHVIFAAIAYETLATPQFSPDAGADYDLGDVALQPIPLIGSVGGRLVDALTGEPLSSASASYRYVTLLQCEPAGCYNAVASVTPEEDGSFRIDSYTAGQALRPGLYALSYGAEQYVSGETSVFEVAEGEHVDRGDIELEPFAVRLLDGAQCDVIPARGGTCRYTLRVVNGQNRPVTLRVWSTVSASSPGSPYTSTFQPHYAQKIWLRPRQTKVVRFSFDVPRRVAPNTTVCTQFYVANLGQGFYFNPINQRFGFCVVKDGTGDFRRVKGDEAIELQQRMHGVPVNQRGRR